MVIAASARLVNEKQLEPTDFARFNVTLQNTLKMGVAKNVRVTSVLKGGGKPGVEFLPDDRWFGDIPAGCEETREFAISTERAAPGQHEVLLVLHYSLEFADEQCATLSFGVSQD